MSKNFYDLKAIPNSWSGSRLKYILSFTDKKSENPSMEKNLSLTQKGIIEKDITTNEGQIAESYDKYIKIKKGQICMNPMDLLTGWVDISNFDGLISPAYFTFEIKKDFDAKFINYFLQSNYLRGTFFTLGKGVASHDNYGRWVLNENELKNIYFFFPKLDEQKKISEYLDKKINNIQNLILKIKKKNQLLNEQLIYKIETLVTKSLNKNVEMKDSGFKWIEKIPKHWKVKKFYHVSDIITGNTPSKKQEDLYFTNEKKFPWVKPGDLNVGFDGVNESKVSLTKKGKEKSRIVPKDSILLCCIGNSSGKFSIANIEVSTNQQINSVVFNNEIVPRFGLHYMSVFGRDLLNRINFVTLPIISKGDLSLETVLVPPVSEQILISETIDKIIKKFKLIYSKNIKRVKMLDEYRKTLMFSTITGKIKI
jgi:type I restriction enzyme, S subunit